MMPVCLPSPVLYLAALSLSDICLFPHGVAVTVKPTMGMCMFACVPDCFLGVEEGFQVRGTGSREGLLLVS